MPRTSRFWRHVTLIALVHVAILAGLMRWSSNAKKPAATEILWMDAGTGEADAAIDAVATAVANPLEPALAATPPPDIEGEPVPPVDRVEGDSVSTPAKSEIQRPTPTPAPQPSSTPQATATPKPKTTPKSSPKSTPKKIVAVKASPAASPKRSVTAEGKKNSAQMSIAKKETAGSNPASSGSGGSAAQGGRRASASEFAWYGKMLHDRFYSEWVQPTSMVPSATKMSALVKIRIEKDGRISDFAIVRSSGNFVLDESIAAVAKRVTQVDPLPDGLGDGPYERKINFELDSQ
jgi:TonB family protein